MVAKAIILIHSPGWKYTITFISYTARSTLKSEQSAGCLSHEPSLMALAPTSLQ